MEYKEKIIGFMKENYSWVIAITTMVVLITSQVIRFVNYIKIEVYMKYFGLNIVNVNYNANNLIYDTIIAIIFLACFYSMLFCYKESIVNFKKKNYTFFVLNIVIIILVNCYYLIFNSYIGFNFRDFIILVFLEFAITIFLFKVEKRYLTKINETEDLNILKTYLKNYFLSLPFLIIILIIIISSLSVTNIQKIDEFRVINDKLVVLHYDNTDYLVLNCEVKGNVINIYYGTQKRVSSFNLETKINKFKRVNIIK